MTNQSVSLSLSKTYVGDEWFYRLTMNIFDRLNIINIVVQPPHP
ncbi:MULTISPECIES: hypothetical protein [unclassified Mucilaginibacter]|nr:MULTISPECIES: hypothetical protein [unclassified Mucilaginibacter]MEB0248552.1 hypothetical protein [Mucilaginibacter sp. 5B2]WPX23275.1 hypothetical protein RHM67_18505 [Mucilaginibacter sp. 5C4]